MRRLLVFLLMIGVLPGVSVLAAPPLSTESLAAGSTGRFSLVRGEDVGEPGQLPDYLGYLLTNNASQAGFFRVQAFSAQPEGVELLLFADADSDGRPDRDTPLDGIFPLAAGQSLRLLVAVPEAAAGTVTLRAASLPEPAASGGSAEHPGVILRDYPSPFFLVPGQVEVSADYLVMNSAVDLFDLRNEELDSVAADLRAAPLGDLEGGRLLVNYGLFARTNLHAGYIRRNIEMGIAEFEIDTAELALRQGFTLSSAPRWLALAVEGGVRVNRAGDLRFTNIRDIDRYVRRIDPDISVSETASHVIFTTPDGTVFSPKEGKPPLHVELEEMSDQTLFARLLLGSRVGRLTPGVFLEYGHTRIDTRIDSNVAAFVGGSVAAPLADKFPHDLDRSEDYWKGGVQVAWAALDWLTLQLAFEYLRLDRDSGLAAVDDNQIVKADATWLLTPRVGLNIGGVYYRRQLNGVIPFLYNRFSRNTFDHDYGVLSLGLIGRWGG